MKSKSTSKRSKKKSEGPARGRADFTRLRRASERLIERTSPAELSALPPEFWEKAALVAPVGKRPISLRVDADVLEWFRTQGPRYQSRMNAVLRAYMSTVQRRGGRRGAA